MTVCNLFYKTNFIVVSILSILNIYIEFTWKCSLTMPAGKHWQIPGKCVKMCAYSCVVLDFKGRYRLSSDVLWPNGIL